MIHDGVGMAHSSRGVLITRQAMLVSRLTIADHLLLFGWRRPFPFGLDPIRNVTVKNCTLGQQRRLMVTIGLSRPTDSLLLLEGVVDDMSEAAARRFMETLTSMSQARGVTLLLTIETPSVEVLNLCDRVWTVANGSVELHMNIPTALRAHCEREVLDTIDTQRCWTCNVVRRQARDARAVFCYAAVHLSLTALIAGARAGDDHTYRSQWACLVYWWTFHTALATKRARKRRVEVGQHWLRNRWSSARHYLASYLVAEFIVEAVVGTAAVYVAFAMMGYTSSPTSAILLNSIVYRILMRQTFEVLLHLQSIGMHYLRRDKANLSRWTFLYPSTGFATTAFIAWSVLNVATMVPEEHAVPEWCQLYLPLNPLFWFWQCIVDRNSGVAALFSVGVIDGAAAPGGALAFMLGCTFVAQLTVVIDWTCLRCSVR